MEELADIEHERWADWQSHCHGKGEKQSDGSILLPAKVVSRWERQINTPYEDLSEIDKEKDREQVRKYLPSLKGVKISAVAEFVSILRAERVVGRALQHGDKKD